MIDISTKLDGYTIRIIEWNKYNAAGLLLIDTKEEKALIKWKLEKAGALYRWVKDYESQTAAPVFNSIILMHKKGFKLISLLMELETTLEKSDALIPDIKGIIKDYSECAMWGIF